MGLTRELAHRARISIYEVGGEELIAESEALEFLDAVDDAGMRVLGVEGFHVAGRSIEPDMGAIADFSDVNDPGESRAVTRAFLGSLQGSGLFYDFVLAGPG